MPMRRAYQALTQRFSFDRYTGMFARIAFVRSNKLSEDLALIRIKCLECAKLQDRTFPSPERSR